jgi:hypothetical protein
VAKPAAEPEAGWFGWLGGPAAGKTQAPKDPYAARAAHFRQQVRILPADDADE